MRAFLLAPSSILKTKAKRSVNDGVCVCMARKGKKKGNDGKGCARIFIERVIFLSPSQPAFPPENEGANGKANNKSNKL